MSGRRIPTNVGRVLDGVAQTISMQRRGTGASTGCGLGGTVFTEGPQLPKSCGVCQRDPAKMNSDVAECSHVDCPHRGRCWSDRPRAAEYFTGPWPKNEDADPLPLDAAIRKDGAA